MRNFMINENTAKDPEHVVEATTGSFGWKHGCVTKAQ